MITPGTTSDHLADLHALHDAQLRWVDAFHGVHDVVPGQLERREEIAEAEHQAALAAIRRRREIAEALRQLDPPTIPIPVVRVADEPDRSQERADGPARPGPVPPPPPVPPDVARMAADLRTEADRAGPSGWTTPSGKQLRTRWGIGAEKARDVLAEFDRHLTQEAL